MPETIDEAVGNAHRFLAREMETCERNLLSVEVATAETESLLGKLGYEETRIRLEGHLTGLRAGLVQVELIQRRASSP